MWELHQVKAFLNTFVSKRSSPLLCYFIFFINSSGIILTQKGNVKLYATFTFGHIWWFLFFNILYKKC